MAEAVAEDVATDVAVGEAVLVDVGGNAVAVAAGDGMSVGVAEGSGVEVAGGAVATATVAGEAVAVHVATTRVDVGATVATGGCDLLHPTSRSAALAVRANTATMDVRVDGPRRVNMGTVSLLGTGLQDGGGCAPGVDGSGLPLSMAR